MSAFKRYLKWSFIDSVISSTENVIATSSMFSAISNNTTSLSITHNYIAKDVVGQLGCFFYINKFSKNSDTDPAKYLNTANNFRVCSYLLMNMTPLFEPSLFIPIAGLSNVMMNISFIGIGAINAKCIQKLSKDKDGVGEIYSKISMVNTFGSTIGLGLGLLTISVLPHDNFKIGLIPVLHFMRKYSYKKSIENLF